MVRGRLPMLLGVPIALSCASASTPPPQTSKGSDQGSNEGAVPTPPGPAVRVEVPAPAPDAVVQIGLGARHGCARFGDGSVRCWGDNVEGQLGLGHNNPQTHAIVVPGIAHAVDLTVESYRACVLDRDGAVLCWGDGKTAARVEPLPPVRQVAVGGNHTCAITKTGELYCWGSGAGAGPIELEDLSQSERPRLMDGLGGVTQISTGQGHTCARMQDRQVLCWGGNFMGQIGSGGTEQRKPAPVQDVNPSAQSVHAGIYRTCAMLDSRTLECWGGTLNHPHIQFSGGRRIVHPADIVHASPSRDFSCLLDAKGEVWCWGDNAARQLGQGPAKSSHAPVRAHLSGAVQLDTGRAFACALLQSGEVWCWGDIWFEGRAAPHIGHPPGAGAKSSTDLPAPIDLTPL